MFTRKIILNSKCKFKLPSIDVIRNNIYNLQFFNILQVNKVMDKLTKERQQSLEKRQQELIDEIEGNPTTEDNEEENQDWLKRIAEDKSHDEMMDRFKKTVEVLEEPGSPFHKEKYDKTKHEFDENIYNKISYVKPAKKTFNFRNMELEINSQFKIKKVEPSNREAKRSGLLAYKMGMTGFWDKFGIYYPLTVLKVDRCQVVQVKTKENQ